MGWKAVVQGASISDVAHFLASSLLRSRTQPYTENSYIDAGRAFLGAYGDHDESLLAPLVGVEILDLISRLQQMSVATIDALRTLALGLLRQTVPLPW
ncbi:hypothetical protein ACFWAY_26210 [Rhodococcus sp. NPDC059968]|uniref:hypothetical protein n=1 Tax=Rhodococcus sp. NPDC059968 TaxID=3347017 RepID=UPI003670BB11